MRSRSFDREGSGGLQHLETTVAEKYQCSVLSAPMKEREEQMSRHHHHKDRAMYAEKYHQQGLRRSLSFQGSQLVLRARGWKMDTGRGVAPRRWRSEDHACFGGRTVTRLLVVLA